jgi:transcriptional regulator with XRE-family HTH domain
MRNAIRTKTHTLLGEWLETIRAGRGMTAQAQSDAIGIAWETLSKLREGGQWLHTQTRDKISAYLDVDSDVVRTLWEMELPGPPPIHDARAQQARVREDLSRLGYEIEQARSRSNETLQDVADAIGSAGSYLSELRRMNRRTMHDATAERLADYLDVEPGEVRAWSRQPAPVVPALPIMTGSGTKYHPTVDVGEVSCARCPFKAPCRYEVVHRDGFAWCERLIPEDFAPQS